MLLSTGAIALLASTALAAPAANNYLQDPSCKTQVKMIAARGTNNPPGVGGLDLISNQVPGSLIRPVVYPATLTNPDYSVSVAIGANHTQRMIRRAVDRCPNVEIVLLGYSQGAHVVLDAACGSVDDGKTTPQLPKKYRSAVKAIIAMGDPSHYEPQTFVQGSGRSSGVVPRIDRYDCPPFTDKISSFCDGGDPYCSNGNNYTVHNTYLSRYATTAATFITQHLS